jgi:hypothetical protein
VRVRLDEIHYKSLMARVITLPVPRIDRICKVTTARRMIEDTFQRYKCPPFRRPKTPQKEKNVYKYKRGAQIE